MKFLLNSVFPILLSVLLIFSSSELLKAQNENVSLQTDNFKFMDTSGRYHSLRELKGRYVYLDIWASWCYPCRQEYPHLVELEKTCDSSKIIFVGISIDQTPYRWQGALIGYQMGGIQWLAKDSTFEKVLAIDRIPRFILINPEGKIAVSDMSRPSDAKTLSYIKQL